MVPFQDALREAGLDAEVSVLSVPSGYPSPRFVNLVLRRHAGSTLLFEAGANCDDIVAETVAGLGARGVERLDALLVTHCHGDHAGGALRVASLGRLAGELPAPIHLHSSGFRYLTQPDSTFLQESYDLFLQRAQWGLRDFSAVGAEATVDQMLRKRYSGYFGRTPRGLLSFVDEEKLPEGIVALPTPGHSLDCVLYYDAALGIAVPGDTIICTGKPEDPETWGYVIPIFTVLGQTTSMAFDAYLGTLHRLRRFFETHTLKMVLPPHGRFAVTRPLDWVGFAERYFDGIYRAFLEDFLGDTSRSWRTEPFLTAALSPYVPSAGSHPVSTSSHVFGMLCSLADAGYLASTEDPHTRQMHFRVETLPPRDFVTRRLAPSLAERAERERYTASPSAVAPEKP